LNHDSTEIYKAVYYLIAPKKIIKIDKTLTIGRGDTDVSIKDAKLSSTHCKISIKGLKIFITDLNSTNGTSINGENLAPQIDKELKIGDRIKIGSEVYTLSENNKPLSDNEPISFQAINLLNLFNVSVGFKACYIISSIFYLLIFYVVMGSLDHLPKELSFLLTLCRDERLAKLPILIFTFYIISFLHAYMASIYLKKSPLLQIITLLVTNVFAFFFTFFFLISTRHNDISNYLKARSEIIGQINMKDLKRKHDKETIKKFILVYESVPENFQPILKKDFENILK
jgi:hypothetical protein